MADPTQVGAALNRGELKNRLEKDLVVTTILDERQIGDGSIDISLGTQFITDLRPNIGEIDPKALSCEQIRKFQKPVVVSFQDQSVLHPGCFLLGATLEFIANMRAAMSETSNVTELLLQMRSDKEAAAKLFPLVYGELRRVAAGMMRREREGHTLQPTAVVHEAYMRMIGGVQPTLENRAQFFALAARAMRQVLVDHARRKLAGKRGGEARPDVELDDNLPLTEQQSEEVLAIHEALEHLQDLDSRQAQIVEMHYFAGNRVEEIANLLGIGDRTVKRELQTARLFLRRQLEGKRAKLP